MTLLEVATLHHSWQWMKVFVLEVIQKVTYKFEEEFSSIKLRFVEGCQSALTVLLCPVFDYTTSFAAALIVQENIDSNNITRLAHMVLQVFPLSVPVEIREEDTASLHRFLVLNEVSFIKHLSTDELSFSKLLFVVVLPTGIPRYNSYSLTITSS